MQTNTATKFLPALSGESRVDLAFDGDETVIQLSTWVEGLGWSTQKTMRLDPMLLDEMHRVITAARTKLRSAKAENGEPFVPSRVLPFPVVS